MGKSSDKGSASGGGTEGDGRRDRCGLSAMCARQPRLGCSALRTRLLSASTATERFVRSLPCLLVLPHYCVRQLREEASVGCLILSVRRCVLFVKFPWHDGVSLQYYYSLRM